MKIYDSVKQVIIDAIDQLYSEEELGIELIKVGSNRASAQFFQELDRSLKQAGAKFEICHTLLLEDVDRVDLNEVLLGAITD